MLLLLIRLNELDENGYVVDASLQTNAAWQQKQGSEHLVAVSYGQYKES